MIVQPQFADYMQERELALRRFATVLTGDPQASAELVGDVLSRAWEKWDHISRLDQPNAYVRKMIVNEFLSQRRKSKRTVVRSDLLEQLEASAATGSDHARAHAERNDLDHRLARLPRQQRAVLVLRYYEDLPEAEIAELLGCKPSTVRSNAARALAALRIDIRATQSSTDFPVAAGPIIEEIR